ncbi:MAG: hypothetical protein UZ18_ATM001000254 [Armatimonadetes bacterium OLB18]|nr:MAG: hypothetical protein UZ18_ATM001000254 [Armatimonadetes bacterium OLB18]
MTCCHASVSSVATSKPRAGAVASSGSGNCPKIEKASPPHEGSAVSSRITSGSGFSAFTQNVR